MSVTIFRFLLPSKLTVYGLALVFCFSVPEAKAQLQLFSIGTQQPTAPSGSNQRTSGITEEPLLTLPFFEDFSLNQGSLPDTSKWEPGSGVFINNSFPINPPSFNVATFDGVDGKGQPYDFGNNLNTGVADILTSHPFDLSGFRNADLLFISFYWQPQGRGELPNVEDSLVLEAKDSQQRWQILWAISGDSARNFQQERIYIQDTSFYHADFQFRFRNWARLSGAYDTWHLDYIYFASQRTDRPPQRLDIALGDAPTSLLTPYSAMPIDQFFYDPQRFTRDSVVSTINHLADTFNIITHRCDLVDLYSGNFIDSLQTGSIGRNTSFTGTNIIFNNETMRLVALNDLTKLNAEADSLKLQYTFSINSNERNAIIRTTSNDTLSGTTVLKDYFAYDDGTSEYGIGIRQRFGRVAYEYVLANPASLVAVDISFVKLGFDLSGQSFNLMVWEEVDTLDHNNDRLRLRQNHPVLYPEVVDEFVRFRLSSSIALSDTFYIGFEQLTDEVMTVGYDANFDSGEKIYYNTRGEWVKNKAIKGSMMIRPVFAKVDVTQLENEAEPKEDYILYPNPTSGSFQLRGSAHLIQIFDQVGRMVFSSPLHQFDGEHSIVIPPALSSGVYLVKIFSSKGSTVKKLIIH